VKCLLLIRFVARLQSYRAGTVATGTAFRLSKTWGTGGGIELHADTASNPALGDSVWRLHSSWSVAHDVINWLTLIPTAEYSHSIVEERNVASQRFLELSAAKAK